MVSCWAALVGANLAGRLWPHVPINSFEAVLGPKRSVVGDDGQWPITF
jgi:hypothetical protein